MTGRVEIYNIALQLADRTVKKPMGEIKDIMIQFGEFIFLVNFIVLETQPVANPRHYILVILGWPLLATSNTIINCQSGLMRVFFENMILDMNIFNLRRQPTNPHDDL